jgi:Tol biopolymer transport system component
MNMKKSVFIILSFIPILNFNCNPNHDFQVLKGPYLGQKSSGMKPEIFAPGVISKAGFHLHSSLAFSPDGSEIYFTKFISEPEVQGTIYFMKQEGNRWTEPRKAFFSGIYNDDSALFTPDGKRLYFSSNRPFGNYPESTNMNIWYVEKTETGWSEPVFEKNVNNPESSEWRFAFSKDGSMYLTSGCKGEEMYSFDIYVSHYHNESYEKPCKLDQAFNTNKSETCLVVEPDEGYMIFYRYDRHHPDELGLYFSYRDKSGKWTEGENMGELFNSGMESVTQAASLSPDGKYLFFLKRMEEAIYWVDAKIIDNLKPKNNKTMK